MEVVPEANFGIMECKNGTPHRNAPFLCAESSYHMHYQTTDPIYPMELFEYMNLGGTAIIRE